MLALVPDLAGPHALEVNHVFLVADIDREQLRRHLLDRHLHAFGRIAAQRVVALPLLVVAGELLLDVVQRALEDDPPALEAALAGQLQPELGAGRPGHRRPDKLVAKLFEDRMHATPPLSETRHPREGGGPGPEYERL